MKSNRIAALISNDRTMMLLLIIRNESIEHEQKTKMRLFKYISVHENFELDTSIHRTAPIMSISKKKQPLYLYPKKPSAILIDLAAIL